ncbi:unnamed protein product, partial [marine sediment metagenome]
MWLYLSLFPPLIWACVNIVDKVVVGKYIDRAIVYLILTGFASILPILLLPLLCTFERLSILLLLLSITTVFFTPRTLQAEVYYLEEFLSFVNKGGKILDVGCGPGIETKFIMDRGFKYEGIDLSQNMLEIAKKKNPTATFQIMDMRELKYPNNNFSGIMALESLIHFPKYEVYTIITDFHRMLKSRGVLLLALQKGRGQKLIPFPFSREEKFLLTPFTKG